MTERSNSILFSFALGIVAGLVSIAVAIMIKVFVGGVFLPELASQTLFSLTPGEFESQAIDTLGPLAKYSAFIGSIIVTIIIFGLIGIFLIKLYNKLRWNSYICEIYIFFRINLWCFGYYFYYDGNNDTC